MSPRKPTRAAGLGVSDEEYARLLAVQGGGCAICSATPKTRRLHVDHDHRSGRVRGLLCHRCNRALPTWISVQWLTAAIRYLHGPTAGDVLALRAEMRNARTVSAELTKLEAAQAARERGA